MIWSSYALSDLLRALISLFFPPKDPRDRWAEEMATTRACSPAEVRQLLAAVKDDYARAYRLLRMWDAAMETGLVGSEKAWRSVYAAAHAHG